MNLSPGSRLGHYEIVAELGAGGPASGALVMELVEGPTLADRLATGALPLDEALAIARQIAEALLVPWKRDDLHKSRSAAPGSQGATTEHIGHM